MCVLVPQACLSSTAWEWLGENLNGNPTVLSFSSSCPFRDQAHILAKFSSAQGGGGNLPKDQRVEER